MELDRSLDGYKLGRSWYSIRTNEVKKITLIGALPNRSICVILVDGNHKRLKYVDFISKLEGAYNTRVLATEALEVKLAQEKLDKIALMEQQLADFKNS